MTKTICSEITNSASKDSSFSSNPNSKSTKQFDTIKVSSSSAQIFSDVLSTEEPLEIRIRACRAGAPNLGAVTIETHQIAVTMRTPGEDRDLAVGFLFTEGIISGLSDIESVDASKCNIVTVQLQEHVEVDPSVFERHSFVASSCGVCGKKSIAAVRVKRQYECLHSTPRVSPETIYSLPEKLREAQSNFAQTGGIHASCLFSPDGKLQSIMEDVGRHNALDKIIGAELLKNALPLQNSILMVSGRASFELVQKAAHAGIPILAAVGAPSSLAVQLAEECNMTLLGFVRDARFNIYTASRRIDS